MDLFRMLTHFITLMPCVSLELGTWLTTLSEPRMPFVSALYLHSLNSELLAVRDITLPATLVDDLSSYLWGLSDVLVALKIATVLTVLDRVGSRPGNAVFLSKSQFLARTLDSPSHTYTERGRTDTLLSIAWWRSAGAMCYTLALSWTLLSTDGFTLALQGWHKRTYTRIVLQITCSWSVSSKTSV